MKKKFSIPAYVTGSGKSGLGVIRALGIKGVPVINISYSKYDIGYTSKYASAKYFSPSPEDESAFIIFLKDISAKHSKGVIIPSDEKSFITISKYKNDLEESFFVPVTDWSITQRIIDNYESLNIAESAGVPSPRTFLPADLDQAEWFLNETGYPAYMKPVSGYLLHDVFKTNTILIANFNQLKNVFTIADKFGRKVMLQEYIPGDIAVIYDSYYTGSEPLLEFTTEKKRRAAFVEESPRVLLSRYVPSVFEPARRVIKHLGYQGYSSIEFKKDSRSGVYKFLKFSGSFSHSVSLAVSCGINFPLSTYIYVSKGIPPVECSHFKEGVYWIDPAVDLSETFRNFRKENISIKNFIDPYLHKKVLAVPSLRDPLPLIKSSVNSVKYAANYIFNLLLSKKGRVYSPQ
jgi:D-aspartate ligase